MASLTIEKLPPELLIQVFEYLQPEELLIVQDVCVKWRDFARTSPVWEDFVYSPDEDTSDEDIVKFVEKCPMVKHIRTNKMPDKVKFVPAVLKNCTDIQSFSVEFMPTLTVPEIDALFDAFPNLDCFLIRIESPNAAQIVDRVGKNTKLKKLTLSGQYCEPGIFKPIIDGCVALEYLSFNGGFPNISEKDLTYVLLNMNNKLSYLQFGFSPITQKTINLLGTFTKLKEISLHDATHGKIVDFTPLADIKTLVSLKFEFFASETNELSRFLDVLFGHPFPVLEKLYICFFHCRYEKKLFKKLASFYPHLKHLRLFGHHPEDVKDGFKELCKLEKLETLIFSSSDKVTDDDIEDLSGCRNLKHLDLSYSRLLTDKAVVHLAKCKTLQVVNLSYSSITGQSFHLIAEHLKKLKRLDVRQCVNLEEKYVTALAEMRPSLKIIKDGGVCFA